MKKISRYDQDLIELDNMLANKKRLIFFKKKNLAEIYMYRIRHAVYKYGVLGYILVRGLRTFGIKVAKDSKNIALQNSFSKQKTLVLPLTEKGSSFDDMAIGVFLHVYYVDELDKILSYLKNIPARYRLCITTDDVKKNQEIIEILKVNGIVDFKIISCRNRGRDIAPFLIDCRDELEKCKYAIHIHTKKSPHDSELSGWADYLYQNLLGTTDIVASILSIFKKHSGIGIIAPEHYYPLSKGPHLGWGKNYEICSEILKDMGVIINPNSKLNFPSGSMFWFKVDAIEPLLKLNFEYEDFNMERGQVDGTLAHAIERTFFYACDIAGFSWLNTITPTIPITKTTKVDETSIILESTQRLVVGLNDSIKA